MLAVKQRLEVGVSDFSHLQCVLVRHWTVGLRHIQGLTWVGPAKVCVPAVHLGLSHSSITPMAAQGPSERGDSEEAALWEGFPLFPLQMAWPLPCLVGVRARTKIWVPDWISSPITFPFHLRMSNFRLGASNNCPSP